MKNLDERLFSMLERSHKDLAESRTAHLRDLRVLLDQSNARELALAGRKAVVAAPVKDALRILPAEDLEYLNDVAVFDENGDEKQIKTQDDYNRELRKIYEEQHAADQA